MAITRTLSNGQRLTDWTDEVNNIANQYGLLNGSDLFQGRGTSQTSLLFDKSTNSIMLIPQSKRNAGPASKGQDRKVETFSLALPYFLHQDYLTPADIQGYRMAGTPDSPETLANVKAEKLEDMRMAADQTREFMKLGAIKGITVDGYGNTIANMFTTLGLTATDYQVDFALNNSATDIDGKISQLKRAVAKNAKTGGRIGKIEVMVSPEFFDALVSHANIREAYLHYRVENSRSDAVRANLAMMEQWGVVDVFEHKGVVFYSYDAEFVKDDGDGTVTTIKGIGGGSRDSGTREGFTIVRGMRGLYRGVFGPSNTLSGANQIGSEMMVYEYRDPKDKFMEFELEMANLYYMERPQLSYRVYSA